MEEIIIQLIGNLSLYKNTNKEEKMYVRQQLQLAISN